MNNHTAQVCKISTTQTIYRVRRRMLEDAIAAAIDELDLIDADPDLEDDEREGWDERELDSCDNEALVWPEFIDQSLISDIWEWQS